MTIAIELEIAQQRLDAAEKFKDEVAAVYHNRPDDLPLAVCSNLWAIYIDAQFLALAAKVALESL